MRTSFVACLVTLSSLSACGLDGPEGMFVQLYGRVTTEHDLLGSGLEVSIASSDGAVVLETSTDSQGWYSVAVLATELDGHGLQVRVEGEGHSPTLAWVDLTLVEGEMMSMPSHPPQLWSLWSRQLPPLQVALSASSGQAEGLILDTSTGLPPVDDAGGQDIPVQFEIELREGWNAPDGEPVVTTVTTGLGATLGRWTVSGLSPGSYTARVRGDGGFTAARFPVLVRTETQHELLATVTRALASNEIRASLVWGESPVDLNLHITGPRGSVGPGESQYERFHVWEGAPFHPANASELHDRVVTMDLLADAGLGPESLTVHEMSAAGAYRFTVFDHSNATNPSAEELSWSDALVQLWIGTREPRFFEVTPGLEGNLWTAAEWDSDADIVYRFAELHAAEDETDIDLF